MEKTGSKKINMTYAISLAIVAIIVIWGLFLPSSFEKAGNGAFNFLVGNFGWLYSLVMSSFVVFIIWIGFFSKFRNVKLGPDDSKPDYSNISWFAMLFSAGMGIGLVFWGCAEPMNFFVAPLTGEPGSAEAAQFAINKAFLHWGLHPWANYAVLALALAYMQFRQKKPALVSSIFIPILGEPRARGNFGTFVDILAIFATISGVATSLGLGALQINAGLNFLFGIPETDMVLIIIVVLVTMAFMASAVSGLDKGIKFLSNLNVSVAGILMLAVLMVGPTINILDTLIEGIGDYVQFLPSNALSVGAFANKGWYGGWTTFYWAWWIAWAPFTASFIARISRGRTIREFCTGVLLAPTLASFVWFAVFGGVGINAGLDVAIEAIKSTSTALFVVLQQYPLGSIISFIAIILLCTFFVTSADSATFVLGMMSTDGNPNPPVSRKVIWGVLQSLLALALMLGSQNGLGMLQTMSLVAAFPFIFIMIAAMVSLVKALNAEFREKDLNLEKTKSKKIKSNVKESKETVEV